MMSPPTRALSRPSPPGDFLVMEMKTNTTSKPDLLSPQQAALLTRLLPVARIATSGCLHDLPVRLRTHSLLIAPSGSGKSHVARSLGGRLGGLPTLVINVSSWVVLSAKNEPWTYTVICQWLDSLQEKGGILVLDEICALDRRSDWITYIRLEVHDLLDGIIPIAARLPSPPTEDLWEDPTNEPPESIRREVLAKRLRERVFIVGAGAWQHAWRSNSRQIGFGSATAALEPPSREQILESIEPELRQRFRNEVGWLPPMAYSDYVKVSANIANRISDPRIRSAWNRLAGPAIEEAVADGLGMRAFEELMLSALLDSHDRDEPAPDALFHPEI